ncbi:MAG TPA: DUF1549 domain-containing protein [Pirellulales bacterium]|nr:DUF1549 domain-containing protein [Pirellulales bacterium]
MPRLPCPPLVWSLALTVVVLLPRDAAADDAAADDTIVEIVADPPAIKLEGPDATYSILVHGRLGDGREVDLTGRAVFRSLAAGVLDVSPKGEVLGLADGAGDVEVQAAGRIQRVACIVSGTRHTRQFNFENDVVPLLSRFGCNSSGCHGKAEGQNGFKLSVFGFDPRADYQALAMHDRGRRVFPASAERSLLLRKATGAAPHGGGVRLARDSREYEILRGWIASGLRFGDADDPRVESVTVTPRERLLAMDGRQQLRVVARYSDGREVDVTRLTRFQSNNDALATVDEAGLITAGDVPGQVAVMAGFMGEVDRFQAIIPRDGATSGHAPLVEANFIDRLVSAKLKKLNIAPSPPADDAEFLRRVFLDTIGTLPTAGEARLFLSDERPDRRVRLLDELFERPEFADYWALKWADLLRVDRVALGHRGAYAYYKWIRDGLAANKPLDRFAREVLLAEGPLAETPQAQFYKVVQKPGDMASTLSQVFLGVRIACAECHHHPFDRWSQTDYYGMVDFFAPLARKATARGEVVFAAGNPETKHPRTGETVRAHALGTPAPDGLPPGDRRAALAQWFTASDNPWFARNMANRVWAHYLGRGLVEPVDDVRATNPPSNPELLDALAHCLVECGFDFRALIRAIVASNAYQLSSQPNETNERDEQNYSRALLKRMDAEVLLDAVCQTTGVSEKFMGVPGGYRAIQLWDSGVGHYFLKLFGRPARRTACECERNGEASVAQVLHFLNSPEIHAKLSHAGGEVKRLVEANAADGPLAEELYLSFYSRFPSDDERRSAVEYLAARPGQRRRAAEDLAWTMLNSLEFMFNH